MFKHISVADTAEKLKQQAVTIADIRDPQSFKAGHIAESFNINNQNAAEFIEQQEKSKPLIVVCYHGHSSQPAAQYFASQGFTEVYSMDGGFEVWKLTQSVEESS